MKFGKDFKKHMVPEWAEAYMDYNGLKRILRELRKYKQSKQKLHPNGALGGGGGDVEEQVIDVNTLHRDGSKKFYNTKFLKETEEEGEIQVSFFRKLDVELNKVHTFYKDKLEEVKQEANQLNYQMDALVALRIKVKTENAHRESSISGKRDNTAVPLSRNTIGAET